MTSFFLSVALEDSVPRLTTLSTFAGWSHGSSHNFGNFTMGHTCTLHGCFLGVTAHNARFLLPSLTLRAPRPGQRGASRPLVSVYSTVQVVASISCGRSIALTSGMGGERSPISKYTVGTVASMGPGLVRLHLIGFEKITDQSFAAVISKHSSLENLSLRYQSSLEFV